MTLFQTSSANASQSLTLAWSPSPDPSVVGYNIYYGLSSNAFDNKVSVTGAYSVTINGLVEGFTYFFAATAYNAAGLESLPTEPISYTVPGAFLILTRTNYGTARAVQISSANVVRPSWTLQTSSDLKNWQTLTTGSNAMVQTGVLSETGRATAYFRLTSP